MVLQSEGVPLWDGEAEIYIGLLSMTNAECEVVTGKGDPRRRDHAR